jgi:hypothetical protein
VPEVARKAIERAGLPLRGPFADRTAQVVKDTFRVRAKRLRAKGKLQAVYSAHDLRHALRRAAVRADTRHLPGAAGAGARERRRNRKLSTKPEADKLTSARAPALASHADPRLASSEI